LLLFEIVHTFSHAVHLEHDKSVQIRVIHIVVYLFLLILYGLLYTGPGNTPAHPFVNVLLVIVFVLDLCFFIKQTPFIWYFTTSMLLFMIVVAGAWASMTPFLRRKCLFFAFLFLCLLGLFYNDMINCDHMRRYMSLPYHGFLEFFSIIVFWFLCDLLLNITVK